MEKNSFTNRETPFPKENKHFDSTDWELRITLLRLEGDTPCDDGVKYEGGFLGLYWWKDRNRSYQQVLVTISHALVPQFAHQYLNKYKGKHCLATIF